jgi:1-deoxy-D-xylulose-5-phosphate reductoisomerase
MAKKRIAVLGATGSIGKSALDVLSREKEFFDVALISARSKKDQLEQIGREWPNAELALSAGDDAQLLSAIARAGADLTINGISGAAGLMPSMAAIEAGSSLALANKESLVLAGPLLLKRAVEKKAAVIPVDSEHSAVFHLTSAFGAAAIDEILLTASGGPFRKMSLAEMERVCPQDALAHPTWNMGPKITIDSATMANKGLEVIEAARLFNVSPDKIKVAIHPQSIVHSMIRVKDGGIYASLSPPDMRIPIRQALFWPEVKEPGFLPLDFDSLTLEFCKPDMEKFAMLALAYAAIQKGGFYPCAYNGANEAAVAAFLSGKISFLDIARVVGYVCNRDWSGSLVDIESVLDVDRRARIIAEEYIKRLKE